MLSGMMRNFRLTAPTAQTAPTVATPGSGALWLALTGTAALVLTVGANMMPATAQDLVLTTADDPKPAAMPAHLAGPMDEHELSHGDTYSDNYGTTRLSGNLADNLTDNPATALTATQAAHRPASASTPFHRQRSNYIAALAKADERTKPKAIDDLARFYWSQGLVEEAGAALDMLATPNTHPLYHVIAVARRLETPAILNGRIASDPIAAFIVAGVRAEDTPNLRLSAALLTQAALSADAAPEPILARYAPALAQSGAVHRHALARTTFTAATQRHSGPAARAFINGRLAEADRNHDTARHHYAMAADLGGRWGAEARLRSTALDWADGRITPAQAAGALETLLIDWPQDDLATRALLGLARANEYAGRPDRAADALALTAARYANTPYAASASVAADRLEALLEAIYVHDRYPELGLATRIEVYARTRRYAPSPLGRAASDTAHLDALIQANLYTEVLALTDPAQGWSTDVDTPAYARRLRARQLLTTQNRVPDTTITLAQMSMDPTAPEPAAEKPVLAAMSATGAQAHFNTLVSQGTPYPILDRALAMPAATRSSAP